MHLIVYTSEFETACGEIQTVLNDISLSSKKNNPSRDITGLLFFHKNRFLQIIEGPKKQLDSLIQILNSDTRHKAINVLINEEVQKRGFEDWNMDTMNLDQETNFEPSKLVDICKAYKENLTMDSKVIVTFFKSILEKTT